jgi:RimJ/RimL family protein N-acetyltransferase
MLDIQTQLFEGKDVNFGPIDHEKDPEIESKWTHDSEFMRMSENRPAQPMSAAMIKKKYEKLEKEIEEEKNIYYFAIRAKTDDRLVGRASVEDIEWSNGNAVVHIDIGSAEDRRKGYGSQSMQMLLRFTFGELNLHRITARVQEYNEPAIALLKGFGFTEEVRRRQALDRDGRRWDLLVFGLLQDEWQEQAKA